MVVISNAFGGSNGGFGGITGTANIYGGIANSTKGSNSSQFPQVGGTGTTAKIFAQPSNSAAAFNLQVPGNGVLEGQQFIVRAGGWATVAGTSPTLQFTLFSGTSLTPGSDTVIFALPGSAASVTTSATYPFSYEARFQGDSKSGIVQVAASLVLNGTYTAVAAGTSLTSIDLTASSPFQLAFGVTFGVSNAGNLAQLDQFSLEA